MPSRPSPSAIALVIVLAGVPIASASGPLATPSDGSAASAQTDGALAQSSTHSLLRPPEAVQPPRADLHGARPLAVRPPGTEGPPASREPAILGVYPNPIHDGDPGEFVVVRVPEPGNWSLADDHRSVRLPANASGIVAATPDPELVRPVVDYRVVAVDDLRLADDGDVVRLRRDGDVVDAVTYDRAPEGELFRPDDGWVPLGATHFPATGSKSAPVEPFVLPDAPEVVVRTVDDADRRILLGGYTLSDGRVVRALIDARERGVDVRVLVDGGPVGGRPQRGAAALDALADAGVEVRVHGGPRARYGYHHAKYAVVDDRAVVLSENWKPSGTGGHASRGWGAVVHDDGTAAELARVFRADAGWRDAVPWTEFREGETFQSAEAADGEYPTRFEPRTLRASSVEVLVAPDNVEREVLALLSSADERVLVQQVNVGDRDAPFLRAVIDAARRGVEVKVLLSSAWYVREDNAELVRWLNGRAAVEGLPLEARLADPRGRYEKVHNKGVVVDGERALVGSVNWNNHSVRENREVALVLEGEEVAGYYERVYRADWRGGQWHVLVGLGVAVVVAAALAGWFGRSRIAFEG